MLNLGHMMYANLESVLYSPAIPFPQLLWVLWVSRCLVSAPFADHPQRTILDSFTLSFT